MEGNRRGPVKKLSFDASDSTPRQTRSMREDRVPCGRHYPGTIIQELTEGWRDTPKSTTLQTKRYIFPL